MASSLEETLASIRWLTPDAELDRLSESALLFIHSAADELAGIWQQHTKVELPALPPYVTRSANDALARWTRSCVAPQHASGEGHGERAWTRAHRDVLFRRVQIERTAPPMIDALRAFRAMIIGRNVPVPELWAPAWSLLLPGFFAAYRHTLCGPKLQETHGLPSPWAPLVALWSRGCWPVLAPNGELIVWVPTSRDGQIVIDADLTPEVPLDLSVSMLFGGELLPPGRLPLVLTVIEGRMMVHPLAQRCYFDLASGWVSVGSTGQNNAGTIVRDDNVSSRYVANITAVGSVLVNGTPRNSFVLTPGDEIEVVGSTVRSTILYLGSSASDPTTLPLYDATGARRPR